MAVRNLANVVLTAQQDDFSRFVLDGLGEAGFKVSFSSNVEDGLREVRTNQPDLILVGSDVKGQGPRQLVEGLRHIDIGPPPPMVLIGNELEEEHFFDTALSLDFEEAFLSPFGASELISRLRPLLRVYTMARELSMRSSLIESMTSEENHGAEMDLYAGHNRAMILFGTEEDQAAIGQWLGEGAEPILCHSTLEAEHRVAEQSFDVVITRADRSNADDVAAFATHIRSYAKLFNLPFLVLADAEDMGGSEAAYRMGISCLLEPTVSLQQFRFCLSTQVRRQQARHQIRAQLQYLKLPVLCDPETGLYCEPFFNAHLTELISFCESWGNHLSVVVFELAGRRSGLQRYGENAARDLIRQVGSWLSGLIRIEDLISYSGDGRFFVSMIDTPEGEARSAMNRIAGILSYADFKLPEVVDTVHLPVQVGMASVQRGDDAESLVQRAISNLGPFGRLG